MRITYSAKADAADIYLQDEVRGGEVSRTYPCDPLEAEAEINLDFDSEGRLIGIEVLGARRTLPAEALSSAQRLDA